MIIQRTRNASRNMFYGVVLKLYQIIIPFLMRTLMIYQMGLEYAGLNNLFGSIFQFLNLAELGIGAALTFSMYEPIVKDDNNKICALLNLYRKCFNIIGGIIIIIGLICLPFLKYLVSGSIPDSLNIYVLYILYLINTVLSYWLFSYKKSLLFAYQRNDIISKVSLITSTLQYLLQIYILVVIHNYYLYVVSSIFCQILHNMISAYIVSSYYQYKPYGSLDDKELLDIKKRVQGLVTNKIGGVILRSADSIVISTFLGLTVLARYQNYYYLLTAVVSVIAILFEACIAGIGNSLLTETKEKNYDDFCTLTLLIGFIIGLCCACFTTLYQPFMKLWMGSSNVLEFSLVISFIVYFFVFEIDQMVSTYKDAAGIWYKDRYRPLFTAILNLVLNIILVQIIGLYGVLFSTIISIILLGLPWLLYNIFHTLFSGMSFQRYFLLIMRIFIAALLSSIIAYLACCFVSIEGIIGIGIKMIITIIISILVEFICLYKSKEFKLAYKLLFKIFNKPKGVYNNN